MPKCYDEPRPRSSRMGARRGSVGRGWRFDYGPPLYAPRLEFVGIPLQYGATAGTSYTATWRCARADRLRSRLIRVHRAHLKPVHPRAAVAVPHWSARAASIEEPAEAPALVRDDRYDLPGAHPPSHCASTHSARRGGLLGASRSRPAGRRRHDHVGFSIFGSSSYRNAEVVTRSSGSAHRPEIRATTTSATGTSLPPRRAGPAGSVLEGRGPRLRNAAKPLVCTRRG